MDARDACTPDSMQKVECSGSEMAAAGPGTGGEQGNHDDATPVASADDPFGLEDMLKQERSQKGHKSVFMRNPFYLAVTSSIGECHP